MTDNIFKSVVAMPSVVCCDPGGCTGAAFRVGGRADGSQPPTYGVLHSYDQHDIWRLFDDCPNVVILELFETGGRVNKYSIHTIELVGAIKALAHKCGADLYLHLAQNRYPCMDDSRKLVAEIYKNLGQKASAETRHEIDAMAGLLTWQMVTSWDDSKGLVCPAHYVLENEDVPKIYVQRTNPAAKAQVLAIRRAAYYGATAK